MRSPRLTVRDMLVFLVTGTHTQAITHMETLLQTDMYTEKTCTASTLTHAFTCALISRVSYFLPLLSLSLSLFLHTHSMTQAGRMCLLPAQISSGSPRHEITWIRDDRLSDQRKTTPWALAVQHQTIVRQCASDPSHMVPWNFLHTGLIY